MLRYIGNGFIPGIPARDLMEEELQGLELSKKDLLKSGLYVEIIQEQEEDKTLIPAEKKKRR